MRDWAFGTKLLVMPQFTTAQLQKHAQNIRKHILTATHAAGSGHPAGAIGIADVLTVLYFAEMNISPETPTDPKRDRFVLSAAHMVPGLYATLAERGFFPASELKTLRKFGSRLKGHTYRDLEIGVETTGGSLGQGVSIALGFALAAQMDKRDSRVYCVIGDGESNEGSVWEAALFAAKQKLDNICLILDRNHIQQSGTSDEIMPIDPVAAKWEAFGWQVYPIDGNDVQQIQFALGKARLTVGKPSIIIAGTVPGKGVSFMENNYEWHAKAPSDEEYSKSMLELSDK